ncbi:hypothetical protein AB8896_17910 [Yersinia enterocolitica]|uniref:hypothetical protein n=1 Tax=Yersinia TaxID=629 RepID=UPI0005DED0CE|nr:MULTISPECIES: hypothetical protein [Yersinia]EKN3387494.1 hypothetical protein [Yersinia enterocolitica]EKN3392336.1 hypothetical protein [Yersinia enterocolitica]EKN3571196.1 hypothetical protein [Yersinia enterocolitica]EKN3586412.1 hypothetical protein [Yersinia enterocolitica]EKN3769261.1 hypothetical protein [Yersinia enterocolitica]
MGKGWDDSCRAGRRDRLKKEVLFRLANGPKPEPVDYTGCDGTHAAFYMRGWDSVAPTDIAWQCQRYKEKHHGKTA